MAKNIDSRCTVGDRKLRCTPVVLLSRPGARLPQTADSVLCLQSEDYSIKTLCSCFTGGKKNKKGRLCEQPYIKKKQAVGKGGRWRRICFAVPPADADHVLTGGVAGWGVGLMRDIDRAYIDNDRTSVNSDHCKANYAGSCSSSQSCILLIPVFADFIPPSPRNSLSSRMRWKQRRRTCRSRWTSWSCRGSSWSSR